MNSELKKILGRVKTAQGKLQTMLKDKTWVEEARKYAEKQGREVKNLLDSDVVKVKAFIERERQELEKFQKQIPGEVKKFRKFVDGQRKELERLLRRVNGVKAGKKKSSGTRTKKSAST